ncbi:dihydrodipicolinate synthase family protein [Sphaerobacter thermophilus]|uniref:Dihydrodipicolinate synthetase n=1 Tax=Sphaerobacter thermophilus (strain ATCC 49802 / DSM 20745 / KCCM 41009 / NCIMB 13125 / S 6022) TaxID=479434 RepID=D1CAQ9_SPHTD|nr:dihydrodipicolinate synthase family protein [Sphaerobacter thermophilus]ACZ40902.1 dihydrodipicolinate synthetase [Sphaerobacter thermophilus DSM 20745]
MPGLRGVYNILSTPFRPDGAIDEASLRRLTEATIGMGVDGITILGVAGEAQKLLQEERRRLIEIVMEVTAGRVPIIVGTSHDGTEATIAASREAQAAGAAGVMVAPPTFLQPGPALTRHYERVAAAIDIPIVLQDFPPVNGVTLSPRAMADLVRAVPAITTIKLEDPPTPQRTAQTLQLLEGRATIVGGLGGMYMLDELRRGASGTMTGFAYPEILVRIWRAWESGDRAEAEATYYRYLPLLVFEGQPKLGVAIRKEILRRRGLIDCAVLREPGPRLDDGIREDLEATLRALAIDDVYPPLG